MANNDDFKLKENNVPQVDNDGISKDDFKFVQADKKIHDQKFETKPTTFLKDCVRRFAKNKSSVVAAFILGFLLVLSIVIPVACKTSVAHETEGSHSDIKYLEPKLFPAGTGFWDGTKKMTGIPVDTSDPDRKNWAPDKQDYSPSAVSNLVIEDEQYTKTATKFGKDGFVQFGYYANIPDANEETHQYEYIAYGALNRIPQYNFADRLVVTAFDVYDEARLAASDEKTKTFPSGYTQAESALYLSFTKTNVTYDIALTDYAYSHKIGVSGGDASIDCNAIFDAFALEKGFGDKVVENLYFQVRIKNSNNHKNSCALVRSVKIESDSETPINLLPSKSHPEENFPKTVGELFNSISFENGTKCMIRYSDNSGYWMVYNHTDYAKAVIYLSKAYLCSFTFDTYEHALGYLDRKIESQDFYDYVNYEWIQATIVPVKGADGNYHADPLLFKCKILNPDKCPIAVEFKAEDVEFMPGSPVLKCINCKVLKYKQAPYNLSKMPIFLLGTDTSGRDMLIYVFEGLRTSLLLGVATTIICFLFGLLWGSISGYFGGVVDLVMERFTDILSGIPWVVVMTLSIIKFKAAFEAVPGSTIPPSLGVFILGFSICITGWIGTAATTRTQFYRFRGREYVLASRTLGASHGRLIAKHILPNAMGTIITSAVLMVPSVIFSEASISYLGLGFKELRSLGVILNDNQVELTNHPYLLIFPAVIIALIMISFNLFGNGLRDAVNPSLKGEDE